MGNRTSTGSQLLHRRNTQYGSIDETEDNNTSLNNYRSTTQREFYPTWKRRVALGSILICQALNWIVFTISTVWIPLCLQLNAYFFNDSAHEDTNKYYSYMERVQLIPVLSLIFLYAFGWISGVLMDSCLRKTIFAFIAQVILIIGFGYQAGIILSLPDHINCTLPSNTSWSNISSSNISWFNISSSNISWLNISLSNMSLSNASSVTCHINEFKLCLMNHSTDYYCLDVYTWWACIASLASGIVLIGLQTLGGDQIPDNKGVRVFYAAFYWFGKVGEGLSAVLCYIYLLVWSDYISKINSKVHTPPEPIYPRWLFNDWSVNILGTCGLALLVIVVIASGKFTRQATPRLNMIKDTFSMLKEAFRRRDEKREDESWLDLAKSSNGGSFADRSVEDRVDLFKFGVIILLLVPVGFSATLPLLPIIPEPSNETANGTELNAFKQSKATVSLSILRHFTAIVAIPIMHLMYSSMSRRNRLVTSLYKFVAGHVTMIVAMAVIIGIQNHCGITAYSIKTQSAQMILLGITKAFIYTTGYELTIISASRAMQGSAMGIFYLMDGIANVLNLSVLLCRKSLEKSNFSLGIYNLINGIGGVGGTLLAALLLILLEKKFNLGLSKV